VPSLALLAFLIPLVGIGTGPALIALFVYGLLPIVRNTYVGLTTLPRPLVEAAEAMGLSPRARLFQVALPLRLAVDPGGHPDERGDHGRHPHGSRR
jgi:osmoprotectant transport system permease protein